MHEWDLHPTRDRDLRLRVCEWGPSEGVPVVILHGYLEQGAAWDSVARPVADRLGRRVVAPDQRGFGCSGHVGRGGFYHFWDYVGDLDGLVEHLGGTIDLVGHSMGGTVACMFAGMRPEKVRRLALIEGLGPPDMTAMFVARGRRFLDGRLAPPRHPTFADAEAGAARIRRWNDGLTASEALRLATRVTRRVRPDDPHVRDAEHACTWTWDPLHRATSPTPFRSDLFRAILAEIRAPTLSIRGADSLFDVSDHAERLAAIDGVREMVLDGAGHMIHVDAPAALANLLSDHLDDT